MLGATWAFFAFPMFDTLNPVVIVLAITIGLIFHAFVYAGQPAMISEMFPTRIRYSDVSLGYQVTSILGGSPAPIIAGALRVEASLSPVMTLGNPAERIDERLGFRDEEQPEPGTDAQAKMRKSSNLYTAVSTASSGASRRSR